MSTEKIAAIIAVLVVLVIGVAIISKKDDFKLSTATDTQTAESNVSVVDGVNKSLAVMDDEFKSVMVSTGAGGLQGDIVSVEPYGDDGIKMNISTNFTDSKDDGKDIARKVLSNLCIDVPALKSVYVSSTASGLDSRSVYRSDIPGCN